MSYVLDIINGLVSMVDNFEKTNGEIINIGSTEELSVLDGAKLIIEILNSKSRIKFIDAEIVHGKGYKDIRKRVANISKAEELIGYKTTIKLEEGIKKTIKGLLK
jgi:nucleoside-diphosphate-sugar epimerase